MKRALFDAHIVATQAYRRRVRVQVLDSVLRYTWMTSRTVVANPLRVKWIAAAAVKTDKHDAVE